MDVLRFFLPLLCRVKTKTISQGYGCVWSSKPLYSCILYGRIVFSFIVYIIQLFIYPEGNTENLLERKLDLPIREEVIFHSADNLSGQDIITFCLAGTDKSDISQFCELCVLATVHISALSLPVFHCAFKT